MKLGWWKWMKLEIVMGWLTTKCSQDSPSEVLGQVFSALTRRSQLISSPLQTARGCWLGDFVTCGMWQSDGIGHLHSIIQLYLGWGTHSSVQFDPPGIPSSAKYMYTPTPCTIHPVRVRYVPQLRWERKSLKIWSLLNQERRIIDQVQAKNVSNHFRMTPCVLVKTSLGATGVGPLWQG